MNEKLKSVLERVRKFADENRRLTLGVVCFVVGFVVGKVL